MTHTFHICPLSQSCKALERVGRTCEEAVRKIENCKKSRKEGMSVQYTEEGRQTHWRGFKKEKLCHCSVEVKIQVEVEVEVKV